MTKKPTTKDILTKHIKDDNVRFNKQEKDHEVFTKTLTRIEGHITRSNSFMESLSWLSDISKGTQLLKRPSLWLVAFVIGIVALMGGLKAILVGIASWIMPK